MPLSTRKTAAAIPTRTGPPVSGTLLALRILAKDPVRYTPLRLCASTVTRRRRRLGQVTDARGEAGHPGEDDSFPPHPPTTTDLNHTSWPGCQGRTDAGLPALSRSPLTVPSTPHPSF